MKTLLLPRFALPAGLPLALALSSVASAAQAQSSAAITGTVQTTTGAPLEFATITLHRATDSSVVKTEFSDAQGAFRLEAGAGRYLVSASQVGFRRQWSQTFEGQKATVLPTLALPTSTATQLKEVTVVGQKPLYEQLADRTIVNVEGSTLAAGNNSLDVLTRSPGVTVDGNDNLALRGKQGLLVLIDGKRQPMTGSELADYLRALPADQLKNIELITNPPAKYDAQGSAGIIAINTKKDQRQGTNGNVSLSYGRGQYGKFTSGLTLNHRHKNLNLFGNYAYADRDGFDKLDINRRFYKEQDDVRQESDRLAQQSVQLVSSHSHTWKAGADYNLGKHTVVGVVASGLSDRGPERESRTSVTFLDAANQPLAIYRTVSRRSYQLPNTAANLNFKHTFPNDTRGNRELTADVDYARYDTHRPQALTTAFELSGRPTVLVAGNQRGELTIQSAKADYTHPLSKTTRLEAGVKASRVRSDNDVRFENTVNGETTLDLGRTNRFRYSEDIRAAYVSVNQTLAKLNVQAGLRGEQTEVQGQQLMSTDADASFRRHYVQLFPNLGVKRTLNDKHEVAASVSRRIDRPSYSQLNPFRVIIDPTTSGSGNPNLRPQTSYNIELTHTYKQKISVGLSYSSTNRPIVNTVQPETDSTVIARPANLGRQRYVGLTITTPLQPAKWWTMHNTGVFYRNQFIGTLAGTALNASRATFNLTSNNTFTLGKTWSAELTARYQAKSQYGFFLIQPYGQLNLGIQKSLWDRKGSLKLNLGDMLYTRKVRAASVYDNYAETIYQRQDTRVATLAFSYRFGNDKVSPTRKRQDGAEDEKRRAG